MTRLKERGGIMIGKTNTPEYGAGANTFNDVFGATRNPWNTSRNAGGSSGGAAASLAVGQTWLSHGSDHAGSLRTPAAFCGIVGLRPSPGRVPGGRTDAYRLEGMQGPMARNVTDCAFFLDAMAGFDAGTPASFDTEPGSYLRAVQEAARPPRISFAPSLGGYGAVSKDLHNALSTAMKQAEKSGATVDATCPDITGLEDSYRVLRGQLWATAFRNEPESITKHLKETLTENLRFGQTLTVDQIISAELTRSKIFANMVAHFETYDVLACAVVGCPPGPIEEEYPTKIAGQTMDDYISWLKFAFLATTTGLPAISLPIGFTPDGMPVGLQLIGPPRGEATLLKAAKFIEDAVEFPKTPIDPR